MTFNTQCMGWEVYSSLTLSETLNGSPLLVVKFVDNRPSNNSKTSASIYGSSRHGNC